MTQVHKFRFAVLVLALLCTETSAGSKAPSVYCAFPAKAVWDRKTIDIDPGVFRAELIDGGGGAFRIPICTGALDDSLLILARGEIALTPAAARFVPCRFDYIMVIVWMKFSSEQIHDGLFGYKKLTRYTLLLRYVVYQRETMTPVAKNDVSLSLRYRDPDCRDCRLLLLHKTAETTAAALKGHIGVK